MKETESQTKLSLKLQAYQYLKTRILNCEYRPNEFLNEQKLCAEMGNISRTPMRDALGRLEQEGLITILPKKGLMVSGITEEDVHSMFEMRLLVEPYALRVRRASRRGSDRCIRRKAPAYRPCSRMSRADTRSGSGNTYVLQMICAPQSLRRASWFLTIWEHPMLHPA